jgi:hypothetical protein
MFSAGGEARGKQGLAMIWNLILWVLLEVSDGCIISNRLVNVGSMLKSSLYSEIVFL